jgi:raffinose/stachyose/melibiose transport system permease protein
MKAAESQMRLVESRATLVITYAVLSVALVVALFPIALLVLNSLKPAAQIVQNPLAFPEAIRWDNFAHAWKDARFGQTFLNSALLTGLTIVLVCSTSSLTAYVLARRKVKSWKIVTFYLLGTTTAPIQLFLFPLYFGFAKLGLINNVFAVSLIYTAIYSPFAVMLLRTYFLAVPRELEEAAIVDGANHWQVFTKVMLPLVSPGILTVALIIGLYSWNEFLIATTFLQKADRLTAVVSFFLLSGQYSSDWGEIMAAALIIVLPVVILFVALQRRFIEGIAGGSVKG